MRLLRTSAFLVLLLVAVILQLSFFSFFSFDGVVPNLVLLVVVAAALTRGPDFAMLLGFAGGLCLDLIPPVDHYAGRWTLALVVVGFMAGRVREDARRSTLGALITVAACSFIGTSIYALSGLVLGDPDVPVAEALRVIPEAMIYDLVLAPFVLPLSMRLFRRLRPPELAFT